MNAAGGGRSGSFLPDITSNRSKQKKNVHHRVKETFRDCLASEKSDHLLTKAEISEFRNNLKQRICVEMLQEGFHRSFSELFSLLSSDQDRRASAEPGSDLSPQTPLEEQKDKMEALQRCLSRAEQAERTSSWTEVCEQRLFLGRFFSSAEDLWLSLHFHHSCADREQGGCSRPATEARACLAELYLQTGDLEQAKRQAELCIKQAEEGGWLDSDDQPLRVRGRLMLWRIYSRMADLQLDAEDYDKALTLQHRGHSTATETEDKQVEAEATLQLGLTYQRAGDHGTAKQFFNTCMQMYGDLEEAEGLGKSYEAMARSLESEGKVDEMVWCLEQLVDISRGSGLKRNLIDALIGLGNVYFKMSQYERAREFFQQGYGVACDVGDVSLVERAQVFVAMARTHCLIREYNADVSSATPAAVGHILAWKLTRQPQDFSPDDGDDTETGVTLSCT